MWFISFILYLAISCLVCTIKCFRFISAEGLSYFLYLPSSPNSLPWYQKILELFLLLDYRLHIGFPFEVLDPWAVIPDLLSLKSYGRLGGRLPPIPLWVFSLLLLDYSSWSTATINHFLSNSRITSFLRARTGGSRHIQAIHHSF